MFPSYLFWVCYLSIHPSIHPSIHLSSDLSSDLSSHLSSHLSSDLVYLSILDWLFEEKRNNKLKKLARARRGWCLQSTYKWLQQAWKPIWNIYLYYLCIYILYIYTHHRLNLQVTPGYHTVIWVASTAPGHWWFSISESGKLAISQSFSIETAIL